MILNLTSQVILIFTLTIPFTNSLTLTLTIISSGTFHEICTDLASYLDLDFELEVQYHLTHDLDRYLDLALHLKLGLDLDLNNDFKFTLTQSLSFTLTMTLIFTFILAQPQTLIHLEFRAVYVLEAM